MFQAIRDFFRQEESQEEEDLYSRAENSYDYSGMTVRGALANSLPRRCKVCEPGDPMATLSLSCISLENIKLDLGRFASWYLLPCPCNPSTLTLENIPMTLSIAEGDSSHMELSVDNRTTILCNDFECKKCEE